jgi:hypothetical protein
LARRRGTPLEPRQIQQYVAWVIGVFRRRIASSCDLAQVRRVIGREMRLDPSALKVARRGDPILCRPWVSAPEYNRAVRHLAAQSQLRKDAPALVGLFHLLCEEEGFPADGEPVQRLRGYLRAKGVSERGWRLIAGCGPRLLVPLRNRVGQRHPAGIVAYLRLLDCLGLRQAPSPAFMNRLLDAFASDAVPGPILRRSVRRVPRTLQRVAGWFEAGDESVRAEIIEHLPVLVGWLAMEGGNTMAAIARHPGWPATLRRAREWGQRISITPDNADPWGLADVPQPEGEFEVRFLRTTRELYDEGKRMRHCVYDYAADCVLGQRAVASIRRRSSGRRVATVMYLFEGRAGPSRNCTGLAIVKFRTRSTPRPGRRRRPAGLSAMNESSDSMPSPPCATRRGSCCPRATHLPGENRCMQSKKPVASSNRPTPSSSLPAPG